MGAMVSREQKRPNLPAADWRWVAAFVTKAGGFCLPLTRESRVIRTADGLVKATIWAGTPGCLRWECRSASGSSEGRGPLGLAMPELLTEMNRLRYRQIALMGVEDQEDGV